MRCAIYFVPPKDDLLCRVAGSWLRRDPYSGHAIAEPVAGLSEAQHALVTAAPRRYGFHATIKAPFRLAEGCTLEHLQLRLGAFLATIPPFDIELAIERLGSFYALALTRPSSALAQLAARIVTEFDHYRAMFDEADLARQNISQLTERQLSHLMSWGYPYVFDQFQFHMTLTGPVPQAERVEVENALAAHFSSEMHRLHVSQLVLAVEPSEHAPFIVHSVHPFATAAARLTA